MRFINILAGPRQVGKTTIVRDLIPPNSPRGFYISVDEEADESVLPFGKASNIVSPPQKRDAEWLRYYWHEARNRASKWAEHRLRNSVATHDEPYLFAIDEIQKIEQWSETVKGLWDADRAHGLNMQVVLLDANHKKATFLRQAAIELKLSNVEVVTERVELYQPDIKFDRITSRAFADLAEFVKLTRHLLSSDGQFVAMKGIYPYEEIALLPQDVTVSEVVPVSVPGLEGERHLVRMVMQ